MSKQPTGLLAIADEGHTKLPLDGTMRRFGERVGKLVIGRTYLAAG